MNTKPSLEEVHDRLGKKDEEIQRLARELDDVKNFMESIFQSIGSGIMVTGVNDTITYVNRAGERILGFSKNELIGKPLSSLSLREKQSVVQSFLDNPEDLDTRREGWMRKKDGAEVPVGFSVNNHLDYRGELIGKIVIFRDLTSINKYQEQLLRMDRLVSLGKLSSGIAHELRNPLAGIKTTAQALGEELTEEDPRREYLQRITKEIDRLNELLKTFFSFAKPQKLSLTPCHVRDIINEIIPFLIKEIADKGIHFEEKYDPHLPRIRADKTQMHQVFLNLFLNAIQAMPEGGNLKIGVSSFVSAGGDGPRQNFIKAIVSDTGKGIPPHMIDRIFDPFFTTKPKGIGLGLSIAHQIINKHGGTIKAESEWEKGTSFVITLPENMENA